MLAEPVTRAQFEHAFAPLAVPAFAVDDVDATQAALSGFLQEIGQQPARFVAGVAVQVNAVLHWPAPSAQFAQGHAVHARTQELAWRGVAGQVVGQIICRGMAQRRTGSGVLTRR